MKHLALVSLVCLSFSAVADEALQMWQQRGTDKELARQAADVMRDAAANETNAVAKALLKTREAEYIYFVGGRVSSKDEKKAVHTRGFEAAQAAVKLLSTDSDGKKPVSAEVTTELARAHYFFAINLGKWGEANGVLSSLNRWPELRDRLDIIDALEKGNVNKVEDFGSYRTRARALHKLPFGDKDEAEKLLKEASEATLADGFDVSRNSTTAVYYLDIMAKNKKSKETFCNLYNNLRELSEYSDEELSEYYNSNKVPETKTDLKNFLEGKDFEENVEKFYRSNC